ncbi:O-antigen ligase family protein [Pedobacter aquatilis]|uniref:O-antigen ligase family protein n=1 Tax=Pedobacter aquatilis TaxID=351343 RepID=UPI00292E4671|nr:O-antigen ligase family protein [Pedobacter aquatilis]
MKGEKQNVKSSQVLTSKPSSLTDNFVLVILSLYFLVDCIPKIDIPDQMGIHWLVISLLNFGAIIYIFKNKEFSEALKPIFKNGISWLYIVFITISGLSILIAINKTESLVNYVRLITTATAFFVFCVLLYKRSHLLKNIGVVITLIVLAQTFSGVMEFYQGTGKIDLSTLTNALQSSTGNKNIFAAALVIKIPIVIYCIVKRNGFFKYLSALSLFFAVLAVFLINARSAYLGLIVSSSVVLIGLCYLHFKKVEFALSKVICVILLAAFSIAFFMSQNAIKKAKATNTETVYGTLIDRLATVADTNNETTNIRLKYWKGSWDLIAKKPILGLGYGNWKLYSPLYTNKLLDDNVFSKHPHNDFIEVAGESGIPNAIIYLSIFLFAFVFTIKILVSNAAGEQKIIAIIILACLSGYFIDAFFNFPSERPNVQLLFAFIFAFVIINYLSAKQASDANVKGVSFIIALPILLIVTSTIFIHFKVLKSMKAQFIVDADLNSIDNLPNAMPKLNYSEVNDLLPAWPNIAENSETIGYKKARYLYKEKRYAEAVRLLDSVHHQSPNLSYNDYLKCNIYLDSKKLDSANKYARKAANAKPRNFYYYRMASYFARINNNTNEINELFKRYHSFRNDQQSWSYYSLSLFYSKADRNEVKKVVDSGLKYFPADTVMLSYKPFLPK